MKIKPVLTVSAIAIVAIVAMVLFVNGVTTGMLSGQQRIPYSFVYGPLTHSNPCTFMECPGGATGMPVGIERYTGRIYCRCAREPIPYYEMPAYVDVRPK